MSFAEAFAGGVGAFFSIWIFCLMQIIPFYIAYVVGSILMEKSGQPLLHRKGELLFTLAIPVAGYMIVFATLGTPTTAMSKTVFQNLGPLNQVGGVLIGLIGLYFAGALTLRQSSKTFMAIKVAAGFLFGAALALAYKPCVTPTLTKIYAISSSAHTAQEGGVLLLFYSLGNFIVISAAAVALAWIAMALPKTLFQPVVTKASGVVLLALAALILSGNMTLYKSYLVGRFVPMAQAHDYTVHANHK